MKKNSVKKYISIVLFIALFMSSDKALAATKIWSDKDGLSLTLKSGKAGQYEFELASEYDNHYEYIAGAVKLSDAVGDSLGQGFKDDDDKDDYVLCYHASDGVNATSMYYTKLDKSVKDAKGNTVYYGDPNDQEYADYLYAISNYYPGIDITNITPIVIVDSKGNEELRYINGGDWYGLDKEKKNKLADTLKQWETANDYTKYYQDLWVNPDNGKELSIKKIVDKSDFVPDPNSENIAIDDALYDVVKEQVQDQMEAAHGEKQVTRSSYWIGGDGKTDEFLKKIWGMIRVAVPVLIIIFAIADFLKVIFISDEKNYKEAFHRTLIRIAVGIGVLVLPALVKLALDLGGLKDAGIYKIFE